MTNQSLTQETLKEFLHYDLEIGIFVWKERDRSWFKSDRDWKMWNTRFSGNHCGCKTNYGYITIGINNKNYIAHRLAWLYMTGEWPIDQLDHINHIRTDNRISNLREATNEINHKNRSLPKTNSSGCLGVSWEKRRNLWQARIHINGKDLCLGLFKDIKDAIAARKQANIEYGYHENHGSEENRIVIRSLKFAEFNVSA